MQRARAFPLALALLALATPACGTDANPLSEVISLMDSLTAKIVAEGEAELKAYKEFFEWCDDAARNLKNEITTATAQKEKLEVAIGKNAGDIEASSAKIEALAGSIASDDSDLNDATLIRKKEAADFAANEAELVDVIDTLSRAISILEREMAKNPAAFAQVDTSSLSKILSSLSTVVDAASFPV